MTMTAMIMLNNNSQQNHYQQHHPYHQHFDSIFCLCDRDVPREIFHLILSFIEPYPYYVMLRSICWHWCLELERHIFPHIHCLNLVDDGRPRFYVRTTTTTTSMCSMEMEEEDDDDDDDDDYENDDENDIDSDSDSDNDNCMNEDYHAQLPPSPLSGLVQYRPVVRASRMSENSTFIYNCLTRCFTNVRHMKLNLSDWQERQHFTAGSPQSAIRSLLHGLMQLETVDIIGSRQWYLDQYLLMDIAASLPQTVRTLNMIGLELSQGAVRELPRLSKRGRAFLSSRLALDGDEPNISVDIQTLNMMFIVMKEDVYSNSNQLHFGDLRRHFRRFTISVMDQPTAATYNRKDRATIARTDDYITYMSKTEGIVLAHMNTTLTVPTSSTIETIMEIVLGEHSQFEPLLDLMHTEEHPPFPPIFQLSSYTPVDLRLINHKIDLLFQYLDNLKTWSADLGFEVDRMTQIDGTSQTILHQLISQCSNTHHFSILRRFVEEYRPNLTVDGTPNCVAHAISSKERKMGTPTREIIEFLLELNPELVVLGDANGIIRGNQRAIPLIQTALSRGIFEGVTRISHLIQAGASLENSDANGNNVIHVAAEIKDIQCFNYLVSICPEHLFTMKNAKNETPFEKILVKFWGTDSMKVKMLRTVYDLPYFNESRRFQDYETSHGNLLATAITLNATPHLIRWLTDHGLRIESSNGEGVEVKT